MAQDFATPPPWDSADTSARPQGTRTRQSIATAGGQNTYGVASLWDRIMSMDGPARTQLLRELERKGISYVPPSLRSTVEFVASMTPTETHARATQAAATAMSPEATLGERLMAGGDMLLETAGVAAAPALLGRMGRAGSEVLQELFLGFSANPAAAPRAVSPPARTADEVPAAPRDTPDTPAPRDTPEPLSLPDEWRVRPDESPEQRAAREHLEDALELRRAIDEAIDEMGELRELMDTQVSWDVFGDPEEAVRLRARMEELQQRYPDEAQRTPTLDEPAPFMRDEYDQGYIDISREQRRAPLPDPDDDLVYLPSPYDDVLAEPMLLLPPGARADYPGAGVIDDVAPGFEFTYDELRAFTEGVPFTRPPSIDPGDPLRFQTRLSLDPRQDPYRVDDVGPLGVRYQNPLDWRSYSSHPLWASGARGTAGLYSRAATAGGRLSRKYYGPDDLDDLRTELLGLGARPQELNVALGPRSPVSDLFYHGDWPVTREDIQWALNETPALQLQRTSRHAANNAPPGGANYVTTVYSHPLVNRGPSSAGAHFNNERFPTLLHSRAARFPVITPDGQPAGVAHHLFEVQSDWAQYRQRLPTEARTQPTRDDIRGELREFTTRRDEKEFLQLFSDLLIDELEGLPPAPPRPAPGSTPDEIRTYQSAYMQWREEQQEPVFSFLRERMNPYIEYLEEITKPGAELPERVLRFEEFVVPSMVSRSDPWGLAPSRRDFDDLYPAPFVRDESEWVDVAVRQNLLDAVNSGADWLTLGSGRDANAYTDMPLEAAERFYNNRVPASVERVLKRVAREAGITPPRLEEVTLREDSWIPGHVVRGIRITDELREALIEHGLPAYAAGGLVTASEQLMAQTPPPPEPEPAPLAPPPPKPGRRARKGDAPWRIERVQTPSGAYQIQFVPAG